MRRKLKKYRKKTSIINYCFSGGSDILLSFSMFLISTERVFRCSLSICVILAIFIQNFLKNVDGNSRRDILYAIKIKIK